MDISAATINQKLVSFIKDLRQDKDYLVFELSDLLSLSNDSVYRRLRGETLFTIEDVAKICRHYSISFDSIIELKQNNNLIFQYHPILQERDLFNNLVMIRDDLKYYASQKDVDFRYAALDVPIFYNFLFPEVAKFKNIYWLRSSLKSKDYDSMKYAGHKMVDQVLELQEEIIGYYKIIHSTEIWTYSMLNNILSQISYYWFSGMFDDMEQALMLCNHINEQVLLLKKIAEKGSKDIRRDDYQGASNCTIYCSEVELVNNCLQVRQNERQKVYMGTQAFNMITTYNDIFNEENENWFKKVFSKSTQISEIGEQTRNKYFKHLLRLVKKTEDQIKLG
jgi:transcriptional regulator with XRE-family HTH domain